jgi:hypothetical protein
MYKIAFSLGMVLPTSVQMRLNSLSSTAFTGVPWPPNRAGIFFSESSRAAFYFRLVCLGVIININYSIFALKKRLFSTGLIFQEIIYKSLIFTIKASAVSYS